MLLLRVTFPDCWNGEDLDSEDHRSHMARSTAEFALAHALPLRVWIEIDSGEHRTGVEPDDERLLDIAASFADSPVILEGVATHGGHSYRARDPDSLASVAEQERLAVVRAADRPLRFFDALSRAVSRGPRPLT